MRSLSLCLMFSLVSAPLFSAEREQSFVNDPEHPVSSSVEDKDTSWKEGATTLPPWPKDSDLVEFEVDDPSARFRQYIDEKSIKVGSDGAVRYTLVIEAPSGTRNVSYEGMRCTPQGAFKIYAYGYNGRFEKTESGWQPIHGGPRDEIHRDLHELILCVPRAFEARPKKDMIRAMRSPAPVESNTGFITD